MRWSNLILEDDDRRRETLAIGSNPRFVQRRLPGYRDEAVVRHFDAPEALETRFYEVRAKSVLNRVPGKSRVPFSWTINPYRGCSHACVYCSWGGTPILMADGQHRKLADLEVGDAIYGTVQRGQYRRYAYTTVLAKWTSVRSAYRVTLEDGTELIASGDHRFLTSRGWKHVSGAEQGPLQRPHLTTGVSMVGTGPFVPQPAETPEYRRGYLCGVIRGDGHVGSYRYARPNRTIDEVHRFRLALADTEALRRISDYLDRFGVSTTEFAFAGATDNHRAITAIRTRARQNVEQIAELISWPTLASVSWRKGFLAGIFDAEGGRNDFALRIANCDEQIIGWMADSLKRFGFDVAYDRTRNPNGLTSVRIRGGLSEHLRFFHLTDPAITRKRSIEGQMVKTFEKLRITSVESLGLRMPMYDITTGTGDFIANGVVSHNCFARPTHKYLDFDAGRDFEREIVVKVNAPEVLRVELAKPSWKKEHVALGTNTDPYQWVEGRYRLMQGIWEAMRDFGNPCSVLTKSPLLLRDLPLMLEIAERASFSACLSIPTLDEKAWRATEPHTPNPKARLEAVAELNRAGIPTGVLIAPLMPGVNDAPHQIEPLLAKVSEAGATSIGGVALHLRGEVKGIFMDWLRSQRPDLIERYEELYGRGAYAPKEERERLSRLVRRGPGRARGFMRTSPTAGATTIEQKPQAHSDQQALF
jgi:DNA repair photolyase